MEITYREFNDILNKCIDNYGMSHQTVNQLVRQVYKEMSILLEKIELPKSKPILKVGEVEIITDAQFKFMMVDLMRMVHANLFGINSSLEELVKVTRDINDRQGIS